MTARKKIVILGGGMGGMSAAYWLTNRPNWQQDYDITLYQLGWRLGGKGATGRNAAMYQRIEEHGFHFFPGFYENTFAMMRQCYAELGRSKDAPLAEFIAPTAEDEKKYPGRYAMVRQQFGGMQEEFPSKSGQWYKYSLFLPENTALPGSGRMHPSLWQYLQMGVQWLWNIYQNAPFWTPPESPGATKAEAWWDELEFVAGILALDAAPLFTSHHLHVAKSLVERLPADGAVYQDSRYLQVCNFIVQRMRAHLQDVWAQTKGDITTDFRAYTAWTMHDFVSTTLCGLLSDQVLVHGFDHLNDENYSDWMLRHAAVPEGMKITLQTPLVQFVYDAGFSLVTEHDQIVGKIEAGTALRIGMRMFLDYMGSAFWMFQAGCGESVFAPLYQVLKRRGVRFQFFHKVEALHLDPHHNRIASIKMQRQVNLNVGEYDPLVMVKGLPCWPSEPLYPQIKEAVSLQAGNVNLEADLSMWHRGTNFTLKAGEDFDEVVLGISLAALPGICGELLARDENWRIMCQKVATTATQAVQLYTNKTQYQLGWTLDKPLVDTDIEPMASWADMTQQLPRENWPPDLQPKTINYFVGFMSDDKKKARGRSRHTQNENVKQYMTTNFLDHVAVSFWPKARDASGGFDWDVLVDPENRGGSARFDAQYWRANISDSERYVLSLPGTSRYRLPADQSGFDNLYLAGDWVKTGLNYGCMEAAAMSGMQVSRALSAYPLYIPGEHDFDPSPQVVSWGARTVVELLDSGLDFYGGLASAIAAGLLGFQSQVNRETLANQTLQTAVVKGIFEGGIRFAGHLTDAIRKLRADFSALMPYREQIDYDQLAARVVQELMKEREQ